MMYLDGAYQVSACPTRSSRTAAKKESYDEDEPEDAEDSESEDDSVEVVSKPITRTTRMRAHASDVNSVTTPQKAENTRITRTRSSARSGNGTAEQPAATNESSPGANSSATRTTRASTRSRKT